MRNSEPVNASRLHSTNPFTLFLVCSDGTRDTAQCGRTIEPRSERS
jgi:hypothetical protein